MRGDFPNGVGVPGKRDSRWSPDGSLGTGTVALVMSLWGAVLKKCRLEGPIIAVVVS